MLWESTFLDDLLPKQYYDFGASNGILFVILLSSEITKIK